MKMKANMERKPFSTAASAPGASLQAMKVAMSNVGSGDSEMLIRQRHRTVAIRPYPPPRTTFAAITMLILGSCLLIAGLVVFFESKKSSQKAKDGAIPMIGLGGICKSLHMHICIV
jgi:hypothetical protein